MYAPMTVTMDSINETFSAMVNRRDLWNGYVKPMMTESEFVRFCDAIDEHIELPLANPFTIDGIAYFDVSAGMTWIEA